MSQVIIGEDPHKLSATIEVVDRDEQLLGSVGSLLTSPATQRCGAMPGRGRSGSGRLRAPTARDVRSRAETARGR